MKRRGMVQGLSCAALGFLLSYTLLSRAQQQPAPVERPLVIFNQKVIEGTHAPLQTRDPMVVFNTVFAALEQDAVVYPTENYYYFQLYANGQCLWGNLRFDAGDRDKGIVHLGYFEYDENGVYQDREGFEKTLTQQDGVKVSRIAPLLYSVTYRDKTVRFHLHDVGMERPRKAKLMPTEAFVGPIYDESGILFFLLFNTRTKHFYYLLNEEGQVADRFLPLSKDILVGRRTGFAFYNDVKNNRKILIGAHSRSVDRNDYYDGPFDQLPDNYVDHSDISRYIQQAYPHLRDQVDRFGAYKNQPGARTMIFPYQVYEEQEELLTMVQNSASRRLTEDALYTALTPDPLQQHGPGEAGAPPSGIMGETSLSGSVNAPAKKKP